MTGWILLGLLRRPLLRHRKPHGRLFRRSEIVPSGVWYLVPYFTHTDPHNRVGRWFACDTGGHEGCPRRVVACSDGMRPLRHRGAWRRPMGGLLAHRMCLYRIPPYAHRPNPLEPAGPFHVSAGPNEVSCWSISGKCRSK